MDELTDEQIATALARGRQAQETEPRAASVRYDRDTGRIEITLENDTIVQIPARMLQGLSGATPAAICGPRWAASRPEPS